MINHRRENDGREPIAPWVGLLVGTVIGTLIGGLGGALAMLLLAPQSGKKTRTKILRQGRKLREQATDTVEDAVEQARDKARQITSDVRKD